MHIHTSDNPAKELGETLSEQLNAHDGDVVCLLSGGSALDVIEHIQVAEGHLLSETRQVLADDISAAEASLQTEGDLRSNPSGSLHECRTIFMMGDERWSRENDINNTLQLLARYPSHLATKCLIGTVPKENENLENFAMRIEKIFSEKISQLRNPKIFMILGMGPDGHTAGIFPLSKESFKETYKDDATYVPVHVSGLPIDSRASLTPNFILNNVDAIFAYVAGESKNTMLESLIKESKEIHERPAELIKLHKDAHLFTDITLEPK